MKQKIIGIAGFICAGKTEAGRFLETLGASFIDADEVVNNLYRKGNEGYRKMVNYFGDEFLKKDGELDRQKISRFVFEDRNKLTILNHLIHPLVTNEVQKLIDASGARTIFVEATYFEPKYLGRLVDEILWIESDKALLKQRFLRRSDATEELFDKIYGSQRKPESVDAVVENNDDLDSFYRRLKKMWEKWQ